MSLPSYLQRLNRAPAFLLLVGLAGVAGLKDYASLLIPEKLAVTLIGAAFAASLIVIKWRERRIREAITKPQAAKLFSPFFSADDDSQDRQWPRNEEVDALLRVLTQSLSRHVSLVGETGVGKTTLVRQMTSSRESATCITISDYAEISQALVNALFDSSPVTSKGSLLPTRTNIIAQLSEVFGSTHITSQRAFDRGYSDSKLDALANSILLFFDRCVDTLVDRPWKLTVVFDQYERHMQLLRDIPGSSHPRKELVDWYLFRVIVEGLRTRNCIRTLFVVRSDWLLQSVIATYPCSPASALTSPDFSAYWELRICHGVNAYSSVSAYAAVRESLSKLTLSAGDLEQFENATGLKSEQFSNTFLVQLSGYLIEHYWDVDSQRLRRLLNDDTDKIEPVRVLFDYIENDFLSEGHSDSRFELLKAVLFTVAIENRSTGTIATLGRIAALAHLAPSEVRPQLDYLCSWGVVLREKLSISDVGYRVGHDLIGDYVIDHERLSAGSRFKDAIQSLSYTRAKTSFMTSVRSFPSLFGDIGRDTNLGQVLILFYMLFGMSKIFFPATCDLLWASMDAVIGPSSNNSCLNTLPSFYAVFVMNCVWLNYIYTLTRGYLMLSLRSPTLSAAARGLPGLGAALALLFSQTLQFALIPIFVVGISLGFILAAASLNRDYLGSVATENLRWGYRTVFNMLFAACLMLFAPIFINPSQGTVEVFATVVRLSSQIFGSPQSSSPALLSATSWMFFGGAIMTYFWWHISAEQQGRLSIASRLALHDRARADHEKSK